MSNCTRCNVEIPPGDILDGVFYDPDHQDIDIGPFCIDCIQLVCICSGCHHPKILGETCAYYGEARHYCNECAKDIIVCPSCNKECTNLIEHRGRGYCETCFNKKFAHCDCCDKVKAKTSFVLDKFIRFSYDVILDEYPSICELCFNEKSRDFIPKVVGKCIRCGKLYHKKKDSWTYCERCYESMPSCNMCGIRTHKLGRYNQDGSIEGVVDPDEVLLCKTCVAKTKRCSCSRHSISMTKKHGHFHDQFFCKHCSSMRVSECKTCLNFERLVGESGNCRECVELYDNNQCPKCGLIRTPNRSCRICDEYEPTIGPYSTRPRLHFNYTEEDKIEREPLFFGIENECTFGRDGDSTIKRSLALRELYKSFGYETLFTKSDSSIAGYGYELVTHPMTLRYFHQLDVFKFFHPAMIESTSCGMHVHVNRGAFHSDLHIYKVLDFIHFNKNFINKISRRDYNGYNRDLPSKASMVVKAAKYGSATKYQRVNLSNKNTVEFRMFQGCTREFELRYMVEFLHALIKWSSGKPHNKLFIPDLLSYIDKNMKMYYNINKFLGGLE